MQEEIRQVLTLFQLVSTGSWWRNRDEFFTGREKIVEFLTRKWEKELDYKLEKQLWCYQVGLRL